MNKWIFILIALFVQQSAMLNGVLLHFYNAHHLIWLIHILFIVATCIDIAVGYFIGIHTRKLMITNRIVKFIHRMVDHLHNYVAKREQHVALFLLGIFSFPHINGFVAAWARIPLKRAFLMLFLGNMAGYVVYWLLIIGVMTFIPNPWIAFGVVIALVYIIVFILEKTGVIDL